MTTWDKIYKDYQAGGEAWASLADGIDPLFIEFINDSKFNVKHALDIGCGSGKYLKFLQAAGFQTSGIDSSQTSIDLTKKLLGDNSQITCAEMFEFQIPSKTYALIISVAVIQHGYKNQIEKLIQQIHEKLLDKGKTFITLPDFESSKKWATFKNNDDLGGGTFAPKSGPEAGLPHSFFTKQEIEKLFSSFKNPKLTLEDQGRWVITGEK